MLSAFEALALLATLGSCLVVARFLSPTTLFCLGVAATIFSGNSQYIGFPIGGPDRALFAVAIISLFWRNPSAWREVGRYGIHYVLIALVLYVSVFAVLSGAAFEVSGFFAIVDRIGIMPFVAFALAPAFFPGQRERRMLAWTLALVGTYIGITAIFEISGAWQLVFPRYIANSDVGLSFGRARGPFVTAGANGVILLACAAAAALLAMREDSRTLRRVAAAICVLCFFGAFLTLTRAVWLAAVISPVVALVMSPQTRKVIVPFVISVVLVTGLALAAIPSLSDRVQHRATSERSIWDRYNLNAGALRAVDAEPLFGVGFDRFADTGEEYLQLADEYPLTGKGLDIHNLALARLAELGIIGGALWALSVALATGGAVFRKVRGEMFVWKQVLVVYLIAFWSYAMLSPATEAMPHLLMWLFLGIVYTSKPETVGEHDRVVNDEELEKAPQHV